LDTQDHVPDSDVDVEKVEACTTSTNTSDDYAHRGKKLNTMPFYVYRMYVRRIPRPSRAQACAPDIFVFESHYAMSKAYVQHVVLHVISVPTIDGFSCPTVYQDAEQNSLLKAILFTPWTCTDPMMCGSVMNYGNLLCDACSPGADRDASQLAASSSDAPRVSQRKFTFQRAWRLRHSEIQLLAERADRRCTAARKRLVLADTTLFAEIKEPLADVQKGEDTKDLLRIFCGSRLQRTMPTHGMRLILGFLGVPCKWHDEQCTIAEFSAYIARDVIAHIDLAAEAKAKKSKRPLADEDSDLDSDADDPESKTRVAVEFEDKGGGDNHAADADDEDDVPQKEFSCFPLFDIDKTISLCLQQDDINSFSSKSRKSQGEVVVRLVVVVARVVVVVVVVARVVVVVVARVVES
jgi:hypothetical protein